MERYGVWPTSRYAGLMMSNHIHFSCIDCDDLQYIKQGECYVCLLHCIELDDTDKCMREKFKELERKERRNVVRSGI